MPIYEFECKKCGAHTEVFQKMNDKQPTKCRKCGGRLERLASAPSIQFKGSGFYLTDYGRSGQKGSEKKESEATSSDDKKSDKAERKLKIAPRVRKLPKMLPQPKSPLVIEAHAFCLHV